MKRRVLPRGLALLFFAICIWPASANASDNSSTLAKRLKINLTTHGRIGFYVDYSERSSVGEHTFYVCRTHGTAGRVSADYATHGDPHQNVSGALVWEDGDASIKSFTAKVLTKSDGDHRIYARLSNANGGVVLHNGGNTIAYGVIEDETIAADSNAVFFDAEATTNGVGAQSNPYNNIYDAIANVGSKRYIYGKGVVTPDGTNTNVEGGFKCITPPASRPNEEARVYVRNWPGFKLIVDGAGLSDCNGFYAKGGQSYLTYRGIEFRDLDVTGVPRFNNGAAIFHHYGNSKMINIERCSAVNVNGTTNDGAYMLWGVDGGKIWRCTSSNIQNNGSNSHQNTAGVFYYSSTNLSIQRCEFSNSGCGIFMKRMNAGDVVAVVRFNIIKDTNVGVRFGYGSSVQEPNYGIVQSNLFKNCATYTAIQHTGASPDQAGKHWICNNVFDNCGGGDNGAIRSTDTYDQQIFNNIFFNCRKMWDMPEKTSRQSDTTAAVLEYADYNHEFGTGRMHYEYLSLAYKSSSRLNAASGFGANDSSGNPLFIDARNDNYTLSARSPCVNNGVDGASQGIYLTGIEVLGAQDKKGARTKGE